MSKLKDMLSLRNPTTRRTLFTGFAFILGFILFAIIGIQTWEYTNSTAFCSNACHDIHPEEPAAYQDSFHARVSCVECHMGRVGMLEAILLKSSHAKHLPATIFGQYGRPVEAETLRPANESCELCHWPPAFHGDTVREIDHFQSDRENTEQRIYLILKTGGGERERGLGYGIHWHIANPVEYIATDEHKQEIRWVRTTLPDGRTVEYNDAVHPLSAEEIANADKRTMDCVDCHNRVGHPFPSPERLVDAALSEGRLSRELPFAKKEMLDLLTANYPNQEAALEAVRNVQESYTATYPDASGQYSDEIEQAATQARELVTRIVFEEPGITWESFPDSSGHKAFPGCFRCHDGKHLSAEGESIRLHCNICHSIPMVVGEDVPSPEMPVATVQEPPSHIATNFIADHRFQANEACAECHGEIAFGSDDSNFCANSACHGQAWPMVELDAAFPHPIELTGEHAEVWCHNCHEGVARPDYQCANCHEPPTTPHFGEHCAECHTPEGFDQAAMVEFEHPVALEGAHQSLNCTDCHTAGESLTYECAACHEPPREPHFGPDCESCHSPTGFEGATIPPELHPIPLVGAHQRATCEVCHAEGERVPAYICGNCHRPPKDHLPGSCHSCHTPEGWEDSAASITIDAPTIPHAVSGLEDCLICHGPDKEIQDVDPIPDEHQEAGYIREQCQLCHKPEP